MTLKELKLLEAFPKSLSLLLQAMWHDRQGNWDSSHDLAQNVNTRDGSWVHAYLHRKEGDKSNALYWYHRAGKDMPTTTLEQEWEEIVTALLELEQGN
jgi:hypothetical protein